MSINSMYSPKQLEISSFVSRREASVAEKFQMACHADDYIALLQTRNALERIACCRWPDRPEAIEVLGKTIFEYGLWHDANPVGFWTAFNRDMLDELKSSYNNKRGYAETEKGTTDFREFKVAQGHLRQQALLLHRLEHSPSEKFEMALRSGNENDRVICEAILRVMGDDDYMARLVDRNRSAKKSRIIAELRSLTGCSPITAYRLLHDFKQRYLLGGQKETPNQVIKTDTLGRLVSGGSQRAAA